MGSANLQGGYNADTLELCSGLKSLYMGSIVLQAGPFAYTQHHVLRMRNVHIWAETSCMGSIFWCSGIAFSGCETFTYGQWRHAWASISWCTGRAFSVSVTIIYGQWLPTRRLFPTAKYLRFQAAKHAYIGTVIMQGCRFKVLRIIVL